MNRSVVAVAALVGVVIGTAVGGGILAVKQRPVDSRVADAVPLRGEPAVVRVDLETLPVGRAPQISYLSGRVLKGGAGGDIVIPGRQKILQAVRYSGSALILLQTGTAGSELARIDSSDEGFLPERVPDVRSLVGSPEQDVAAYATTRSTAGGGRAKGSTIYWLGGGTEVVRQLKRPGDWGSTVLAVVRDTVYFAAATGADPAPWTLNSWDSARGKVTQLSSMGDPILADDLGRLAVTREPPTRVGGSCPAIIDVAAGRRLWRSCEYLPVGFTFDGRTILGTSTPDGGGAAALDARTGELKRRWTGGWFRAGVAEDDDHLLFFVDTGARRNGAIIRCSIDTGRCELATTIASPAAGIRLLAAH